MAVLQITSSGSSLMYSRKSVDQEWTLVELKQSDVARNSVRFSLWQRPTCQTLSKALDISSATVQVAPDLLEALAIILNTIVRGSALDWEDLKPYWKTEKRSHTSRWSKILLFTSFLKTLLTTERRLTGG